MAGRRAWRVAAVVGAVVIVALGVLPTEALIRVFAEGDGAGVTVGGHFAGYAVYAFVVAVASGGWRLSRRALLLTAALAVGLGIVVELLQAPIPYRDAQALDVAVNAAGVALGLAAFSVAVVWRARPPRWRCG